MLLSEFIGAVLDDNPVLINEQDFDSLAPLDSRENFRTLTFIEDAKYAHLLSENVTMILTTEEASTKLRDITFGICIVANPRVTFFEIHNYLSYQDGYKRKPFRNQIHPTADVSPFAYIEDTNVIIEAGATIEPFAKIYSNSTIGRNTIVRAGASVGGVGFEFKRVDGEVMSVVHSGGMIIAERVEVHNNVTIDRALYPWDNTIIGSSTIVHSQAYVAHGCKVGSSVVIGSQAVIGGRNIIGDDVEIGDGSAIRQLLVIQAGACIEEGAVVTKSVDENAVMTGNFALLQSDFSRIHENRLFACGNESDKLSRGGISICDEDLG